MTEKEPSPFRPIIYEYHKYGFYGSYETEGSLEYNANEYGYGRFSF